MLSYVGFATSTKFLVLEDGRHVIESVTVRRANYGIRRRCSMLFSVVEEKPHDVVVASFDGCQQGAAVHSVGLYAVLPRVVEEQLHDVRVAAAGGDEQGLAVVSVEQHVVLPRVVEQKPHDLCVAFLGGFPQCLAV